MALGGAVLGCCWGGGGHSLYTSTALAKRVRSVSFALLCGSLPPTTALDLASAKKSEARGRQTTGFKQKGGSFYSITLKTMENQPNSGDDYVVTTVRLPVRLLAQLSRWLVVAGSMYVLLNH